MATKREDIKYILDDYRRQHKEELSSSKFKAHKFKSIYEEFMSKRNEGLNQNPESFFYFINKLNKMARDGKFYCGVDIAQFAKKLKAQHLYKKPFDINLLEKDKEGHFVTRKKTVDGWEYIPLERGMFSIFMAFIQKYLDSEILGGDFTCPEEADLFENQNNR